ncbi:MAG TPA: hypothetical protein VGR84_18710 [Candidatus Acidoferrales bacterium]|nr:hypothetical protein [Candidatus Acidoferrales bacterium]
MPTTIDFMVRRWESSDRPLFKGKLIDDEGCCCAQGDILRVCGVEDDDLRRMDQFDADLQVAKELGISLSHSVLLRQINDKQDGCPQDVLAHPERIIGGQSVLVLNFWRYLDDLSPAAWAAAGDAARAAARAAAVYATYEVMGASRLEMFFFLPMFGIPDHTALGALK